MNSNKSVATIDAPEFINVTKVSPLISKCNIKVFYLGRNRNGSYIDKETAIEMADTLRGNPIVAAYRKEVGDFGDHGEVIHIEDGEISFSCKTVPYGFVSTDAEVWFQKFIDTDEFGNETEREYLMTTGYLWTGQYEELNSVIAEGKGQSMELDPETIDGHWAFDDKSGYEFFIINDATISKLCILGDDVEPCFEGASVTGAAAANFSLEENDFKSAVQRMMFQLKDALQNEGGLNNMDLDETQFVEEQQEEIVVDETPVVEDEQPVVEEEFAAVEEEEVAETEFAEAEENEDDEEEKEPKTECSLDEETPVAEEEVPFVEEEAPVVEEEPVQDFQAEIDTYKAMVEELQAEVQALREFRLSAENEKKDALIAKYFMLSDADKADVITNKENYSLEEIESKLALTYVRINADSIFSLDSDEEEEQVETGIAANPALAFSLEENEDFAISDMLRALRNTKH